ncbi:MAG TPA: DUF6489 family protein [Beijerinckiaceae bacterium]|nr:DUF6489 family protein [Beijerinckiaceae bacterium]
MNVTINIDCTPLEARQFFGLPDVQPMQEAVLGELQRKMLAEMNNFSTDKIMSAWLSMAPQNAEWMKMMFDQFSAFTGGKKPSGR